MRRKTSKLETRVWKFGCWPPTVNAELVREQLYAATVYQNVCIEMRQQQLEEFRVAERKHFPKLAKLRQRAEEIKRELVDAGEDEKKKLRAKLRTLSKRMKKWKQKQEDAVAVANEAKKKRVGVCAPKIAEVRNAEVVGQMLKEKWPRWWKVMARLERADNARRRQARARASCSKGVLKNRKKKPVAAIMHGTYDVCERAAEAAWKAYFSQIRDPKVKAKTRAKMIKRGRPRFVQFDGSGILRVQMTEPRYALSAPGERFAVEGQWLQIEVAEKRPWQPGPGRVPPTPGSKRQARLALQPGWGVARLRIGSDQQKQSIWTELPIYVHRRLPPDAVIKWTALVVKREGPRLRYELQLTCESVTFGQLPEGHGLAAINFGWRALGGGRYRIAYLVDEQGHEEELVLGPDPRTTSKGKETPWSVPTRLHHADGLRSAIDKRFNEAKSVLAGWLEGREVGAELREATEHLGLWRDPKKLVRAVHVLRGELGIEEAELRQIWQQWRLERLAEGKDLLGSPEEVLGWCNRHGRGDPNYATMCYLDFWRYKQRHLYRYQTRQRNKAIAHRRNLVQCWMKRQVYKYAEIVAEDYDLRKVESACVKEEDEDRQAKLARKNRTFCAPGEARATLVRLGGSKVTLNPTEADEGCGDSQVCSACGLPCGNDLKDSLVQTCPHCGNVEDQDARNCRNQIRRRREGSGGDGEPGSASNSKEAAQRANRAAIKKDGGGREEE